MPNASFSSPSPVASPYRSGRFLPAACVLALCLMLAGPAQAHRVNIFAFVDGTVLQTECSFSSGTKVQSAPVDVLDAQSGNLLQQGTTDTQGRVRFAITPAMKAAPKGLILRVRAGEGHQGEWTVEADELTAVTVRQEQARQAQTQQEQAQKDRAPQVAARAQTAPAQQAAGPADSAEQIVLTRAELQALVREAVQTAVEDALARSLADSQAALATTLDTALDTALDQKLAPVRRMLSEQTQKGPGLQEIIGGLGWILGLVGLAAWLRRRP
ncbi:MAG TPA: hypothetical protein H9894_05010 [Candidatus Desulfovibrio intestinipullorum]|uniref:Nickel transport protein n=1 Tax=Candidatus Desulfovibrio intestinipullorum TaxID=2838536 RepID=A0A9D1TPX7_9BACT|nr:hypothetical protein [Candidatus Desulfovibrio intestinipullorum]